MTMRKIRTFCCAALFLLASLPVAAQEQSFRNPVVSGFHPDPSVCRVGDTFYLINSTFQYFPGVPIYESKDLIHWRQVGNILTRDSQLPLEGAASGTGIFAPTLRYNDGVYYMVTTNISHGGNFMVTATSPEGPWSDPIKLSTPGIDPSLYFEDGKCYLLSNGGDFISLCEIDPKTGKQLTETKPLWGGEGGRYPEGPHLYKKDGYYYLLISEGGTELAHHLTIARSKNIYGPYEGCPDNPILTNCSRLGQYLQVQGIGHGDFTQAPDGSWWVICLGYRHYGGMFHHLGRETFLAPVEWKEGEWPVVNGGMPVDTLTKAKLLPQVILPKSDATDFKAGKLGPEFLYIQNPIRENYAFQDGVWTLKAHGTLTQNDQPTYIGIRQTAPKMTFETEVSLPSKEGNPRAGLTVYQTHEGHIDFAMQGSKLSAIFRLKSLEADCGTVDLGNNPGKVRLRVTSDGLRYVFSYSLDGKTYQEVGSADATLLSTEVLGGFTGVTLGLFVEGDNGATAKFHDFSYVE